MKKRLLLILSLGFVLAANLYFRSFPIYFPQLKDQARQIVENSIQQGTMADVYKKFPQFYPLAKDEIKKSRITEYKKQNKKTIDEQINNLYRKFKERYQDESGQTYIMELDCWHWSRYVENVIRLGHPGDEVIGGKQWDMFMLAPAGWAINWDDFLYYFSAFLYKVFTIFVNIPLLKFLFYMPLFMMSVFLITLYAVSFRYGRYIGATLSCLVVGLAPVFMPRSCAGWFDKDILALFFPVAIFGTYVSIFKTASSRQQFLWVLFSSFLVGLFAFAWTHWWFIFGIIVIYELLAIGYLVLVNVIVSNKDYAMLKRHLFILVGFVGISFVFILLMAGIEPLAVLGKQLMEAVKFNKPLISSIWPNVFSTVGEMRKTNINEIMYSVVGRNGRWLFVVSFLSMAVLLVHTLRDRSSPLFKKISIIILVVWFAAMSFATTRGVRFVMFLTVPLGISLGWAVNEIYGYFRNRKNLLGVILTALFFIAVCASCLQNGRQSGNSIFPLMTTSWYKVLHLMNDKTPKDTIVNSWWDYGDWFKVVAKRRVIFDGQSQGTPQAYWMAKALLTDDETRAISILRMLNNGGNKAFDIIDSYVNNQLFSALLLENVMVLQPERARQALSKFLPTLVVDDVMKLLFSNPPSAIFVVDESMPYKIGAISYLGNWDFSKVYIAKNFDKQEKGQIIEYLKDMGRDEQDLQRFYQEVFLISTKNLDDWLSHRLQFYSGVAQGQEKNGVIYFDNGFAYNPKDKTLQSNNGQIPRSLFIQEGDDIIEAPFPNANIVCSLLIYQTQSGYRAVLLDRELGKSMFTRLYFLRGKGLKHFMSFIDAEEGDNYIRVFSVSW